MAGESDADFDRKAENFERVMNPSKFKDSSLGDFTDEQLQAELKRRKREKQTEETRLAKIRAHNAPIQREIEALQRQLHSLNLKLKK